MKRAATLEDAADQIVKLANARDKQGRVLNPMMQDPVVTMIFYAKDALLEVLIERPIALLNLISTNKQVASFMEEFNRWLWPLVIERFMEKESGSKYLGEIYPFFFAKEAGNVAVDTTPLQKPPFIRDSSIGWIPNRTHRLPGTNVFLTAASRDRIRIGWVKPQVPYYVIKYDRVSELYFLYMQKLMDAGPKEYGRETILPNDYWLKEYLGDDATFIGFNGYFLIDREDSGFLYDLETVRSNLYRTMTRVREEVEDARNVTRSRDRVLSENDYSRLMLQEEAVKLGYMLNTELERTQAVIPAKPILLNKNTVSRYRAFLFDKVKGKYNTPEKQKKLLISLLQSIRKSRSEIIEKYGELAPLQCDYCTNDAYFVNTARTLTFCSGCCPP